MTELFDKGLKVRKEVLGEDYVNKSIAGADEFTRTMAEWSTEFCWGALWTRPGLDRRTRSIVNLAMLGSAFITAPPARYCWARPALPSSRRRPYFGRTSCRCARR